MAYLLDTNICIYTIKNKPAEIASRLAGLNPKEVFISSVTMGELYYGMYKSRRPEVNLKALEEFLQPFQFLSFKPDHARKFGEIRAALEKKGKPIGSYDMQIAAQAVVERHKLVSNNLREFRRVPRLACENWL